MTLRFAFLLAGLSLACGCSSSDKDPAKAPGPTCPAPIGAGVTHDGTAVTADTTWTAADSPHIVTFGFNVEVGATLTIEPCAEVRMQPGYSITVKGNLHAEGSADKPITFRRDDPAEPWGYLQAASGKIRLAHVMLEGGGTTADTNGLGVLDIRGDQNAPAQELLFVDTVTIAGSQQFGVSLREGGTFFASSKALTISDAAMGPIRSAPRLATNIPVGTYTNNGIDQITLAAEAYGQITHDTTFRERGVPYYLGSEPFGTGKELRVGAGDGSLSTLTIEPGVTIRFDKDARFIVEAATSDTPASGVLIAAGTAAAPIVLTSAAAAPLPGDWLGIWFGGKPRAENRIDNARIEYAGGPSQAKGFHCGLDGSLNEAEDAAVIITNLPAGAFVTNTVIKASAGYGVDRGWRGESIDFIPTNTFEEIGKCKQSTPRDQNGACPGSIPCP